MADIQHSVQIAAAPSRIYPLVASAEGFRKWWATDITEPVGAVELGFFKRSTVYRLRLKVDDSPLHAEWVCETGDEWNGTRIIFQCQPSNGGSSLRFTHGGWKGATDYFVSCNTTWGELMYRLKAAAEGKAPGPLFLADKLAY